jgi:hypothetical protein
MYRTRFYLTRLFVHCYVLHPAKRLGLGWSRATARSVAAFGVALSASRQTEGLLVLTNELGFALGSTHSSVGIR